MKSIKHNLFMNILLMIVQYVYPLLSFPYISRILDASGIGKVNFALSFISYFSMFALLGIPTYGIRCVAKFRDNKSKLSQITQELTIIILVCTSFCYLVLLVCIFKIDRLEPDRLLFLVMSVNVILSALNMQWFYQGLEMYDYITKRSIMVKTFSLLLIFIMVKNKRDYLWYGIASVLTEAGNSIFNFINIRKYIYLKPCKSYDFKRHYKPILLFFTSSVATNIYNKLDSVMLGFLANDIGVGIYTIGIKISKMLLASVSTVNTVLLPRISNLFSIGSKNEAYSLIKKVFSYVYCLAIPLIIGTCYMSKEIIWILSGEGYDTARYVLISSIPILFIVGVGGILCYLILIPLNNEKKVSQAHVIGMVVNLVLNFIMIPYLGESGAALATTLTELVICIFSFVWCYKIIGADLLDLLNIRELIKTIFAGLIMLLALIVMNKIIMLNSLTTIIITVIFAMIIYLVSLLAIKSCLAIEAVNMVIKKIIN